MDVLQPVGLDLEEPDGWIMYGWSYRAEWIEIFIDSMFNQFSVVDDLLAVAQQLEKKLLAGKLH